MNIIENGGVKYIDIDLFLTGGFYVNKKLDLWVCQAALCKFFDLPNKKSITLRLTNQCVPDETVRVEAVDMISYYDTKYPGILVEYGSFYPDAVFKELTVRAILLLGNCLYVKVLV